MRRRLFIQVVRRILADSLLIALSFYLAMLILYSADLTTQDLQLLLLYLLPISLVYVECNALFGVYGRLWAYASVQDVLYLAEATGLATVVLLVVNLLLLPLLLPQCLPSSVLLVGGMITMITFAAMRYRRQLLGFILSHLHRSQPGEAERVLIVGCSETSHQLAQQISTKRNGKRHVVVGYVDDDQAHLGHLGMNIDGVRILGSTDRIPQLVQEKKIDIVVIASRPCGRDAMWRLVSLCQGTSAQVKVLPDPVEVLEGQYEDPLSPRDISVEDILGREPAQIDLDSCRRILEGRVVLVTGAAGSIGSELCRQVLGFAPRLLVAVDNNETGLYELSLELNPEGLSPMRLVLADISDWNKVARIFEKHKPQIVFHAAAFKHVPMMEVHPEEALRVNVVGSAIIGEMAHRNGAERLVFISTDKAVHPSSVMGASKRIGELWMRALAEESQTIFCSVRFGNVIGSRGSVIPTFSQQIETGRPLTVTDAEMRRYFISIPEAVSLVLQAAAFGTGGDVFMLDMGEELSILGLAQRMIRLRGLRVGKDIEIQFTGQRPGEKMSEELAYESESRVATPHPRIHKLTSKDKRIDHDTMLGIIAIMSQLVVAPNSFPLLRDALFQVASQDIDAFLDRVVELGLQHEQYRLGQGQAGQLAADRAIPEADEDHIVNGRSEPPTQPPPPGSRSTA